MSVRTWLGTGFMAAVLLGGVQPARAQGLGAAPVPGPAVEFSLPTTAGAPRTVSQLRGRVVVIFYESRDAIGQNQLLKDAIGRQIARDPSLAQRFALVAIANLAEFAFWPAEYFAREAVTQIARRNHVELWLDWRRALVRTLGVRDGSSNVVVLDRAGRVRMRRAGTVPPSQVDAFLQQLAAIANEG